MKIHLSLNENTFTFCQTTKVRFFNYNPPAREGRAGGCTQGKTRAVVGIRISATQATPAPCDSGVQRRPNWEP